MTRIELNDPADTPKMIRETLCVAQTSMNAIPHRFDPRKKEYVARFQRMINELDRMRPLGPDGKHGDRHTPECGCDG